MPSEGCFTAKYPSAAWSRTACARPSRTYFPVPRPHFQLGQVVGNYADYEANAAPQIISTAVGEFPIVQGVKREKSRGARNDYSIQLNSNYFQTAACVTLPNCQGWSQFVYVNPRHGHTGRLFIQNWLFTFTGYFNACPTKGWIFLGYACVKNSREALDIPNIDISQLGSVTLTGAASPSGDSVHMTIGTIAYGMKKAQSDGITDLSQNWQGAEFNVFGGGGGDQANINPGSTITVSIQVDDGISTAPICAAHSGTTGETNNLNLVAAPASPNQYQYPSIEFTETSQASTTATCDASNGTE
jgi:hypothetical protein